MPDCDGDDGHLTPDVDQENNEMNRDVSWTEERRLFKNVTETTSIIAWATDVDARCYYLSPEWFDFTGTAQGDGIGFNWLFCVHPDDIDCVRQGFFRANDNRVAFGQAYRLVQADGSYRVVWGVGFPKFDENLVFHGFFGTVCTHDHRLPVEHAHPVGPVPRPAALLLSAREREIITLISQGNTTDTVSAMLGIAARTVDSHVASAAAKLGSANRVHTVARAIQLGEI